MEEIAEIMKGRRSRGNVYMNGYEGGASVSVHVGDETKHMRYVTCMTATFLRELCVAVVDNISKKFHDMAIYAAACPIVKGSFHVMRVKTMLIMGSCPLPPSTPTPCIYFPLLTYVNMTPLLGPFKLLLPFSCLFW